MTAPREPTPNPGKQFTCRCGRVLGFITDTDDLVLKPGTRVEYGHWATTIICDCGKPKAYTGRSVRANIANAERRQAA